MARLTRFDILKALLGGGLTAVGGLLLLGLPGAAVLEALTYIGMTRPITGDAAWPAAILVTIAGGVCVALTSLALRRSSPGLTGWRHALATAGLALVVTCLGTILAAY